jgi:hypothetical protein
MRAPEAYGDMPVRAVEAIAADAAKEVVLATTKRVVSGAEALSLESAARLGRRAVVTCGHCKSRYTTGHGHPESDVCLVTAESSRQRAEGYVAVHRGYTKMLMDSGVPTREVAFGSLGYSPSKPYNKGAVRRLYTRVWVKKILALISVDRSHRVELLRAMLGSGFDEARLLIEQKGRGLYTTSSTTIVAKMVDFKKTPDDVCLHIDLETLRCRVEREVVDGTI